MRISLRLMVSDDGWDVDTLQGNEEHKKRVVTTNFEQFIILRNDKDAQY